MSILDTCRGLPIKTFAAGGVLMDQDESSDRLLILIDGRVAVVKGKTQVAETSEPGSVFGEISALLDIPTSAKVVALEDTRVYEIEQAAGFISKSPEMAMHTARMLAQRLVDATTYLADLKRQYQGHTDHFGMVDQVLEKLLQQQERWPMSRRVVTRSRSGNEDPRL